MTISDPLIEKINLLFQKAEVLWQRDTRAKAQSILDRMEADNITIKDLLEAAGTKRPKQDTRISEPAEAALHVGHPARFDGGVEHAAQAARESVEVGSEGGGRSVRANSVAYWRFISN